MTIGELRKGVAAHSKSETERLKVEIREMLSMYGTGTGNSRRELPEELYIDTSIPEPKPEHGVDYIA